MKPTREQLHRTCTRKRRYKTQGDALEAAALLNIERQRTAYLCPHCKHWHLATR